MYVQVWFQIEKQTAKNYTEKSIKRDICTKFIESQMIFGEKRI